MYIREIKEEYPLIYERIIEQTNSGHFHRGDIARFELQDVNGALTWSDTTEGDSFWLAFHHGNFEEARNLQPHLFGPDTRPVREISNGLFKQVN